MRVDTFEPLNGSTVPHLAIRSTTRASGRLRRDRLARLFDDVFGRAVELGDQSVDLGARNRIDLELELVRLLEEGRVPQGLVECLAQRLLALLGHAERRREWPAHHLPSGDAP